MNHCLDDIFWATEDFVTKLSIVMQYHEPECRAEQFVCYFQCQGHSEGSYDKNMTFYSVSWTAYSLAGKLVLMVHYRKWEYLVKKIGLLHSSSKSQWRLEMSFIFVQLISIQLPNINQTWYGWSILMSQSVMQKDWFASFMVKVTTRAPMIKICHFVLYLMNHCWCTGWLSRAGESRSGTLTIPAPNWAYLCCPAPAVLLELAVL